MTTLYILSSSVNATIHGGRSHIKIFHSFSSLTVARISIEMDAVKLEENKQRVFCRDYVPKRSLCDVSINKLAGNRDFLFL